MASTRQRICCNMIKKKRRQKLHICVRSSNFVLLLLARLTAQKGSAPLFNANHLSNTAKLRSALCTAGSVRSNQNQIYDSTTNQNVYILWLPWTMLDYELAIPRLLASLLLVFKCFCDLCWLDDDEFRGNALALKCTRGSQ